MKANFEFYEDKDGKHFFRLKQDKLVMLTSVGGYPTKSDAMKATETLLYHANKADRYGRNMDGEFRTFTVHTRSGKVIARSESYNSAHGLENGILAVRRICQMANTAEILN